MVRKASKAPRLLSNPTSFRTGKSLTAAGVAVPASAVPATPVFPKLPIQTNPAVPRLLVPVVSPTEAPAAAPPLSLTRTMRVTSASTKNLKSFLTPLKKTMSPRSFQHLAQEIREVFDLFDTDGSGNIDLKELRIVMRSLGFNPTPEEALTMAKEFDETDEPVLSFEEFLFLMAAKMRVEGRLGFRDLKRVAKEIGEFVTDEEIQTILRRRIRMGMEKLGEEDWVRVFATGPVLILDKSSKTKSK
ncbi:hypothetical protein BC829DRAFT_448648 [Chytridium lagenaria]|nr:hypothetical protein BC829DRAFT_448648 [Chytridium lagenaria]